jgi:hypothetical protein
MTFDVLTVPRNDAELEERLSRPTPAVVNALRRVPGDVIVLGAGGKMGPSLTKMVRRALDESSDTRDVIAVSRFSSPDAAADLERAGCASCAPTSEAARSLRASPTLGT